MPLGIFERPPGFWENIIVLTHFDQMKALKDKEKDKDKDAEQSCKD